MSTFSRALRTLTLSHSSHMCTASGRSLLSLPFLCLLLLICHFSEKSTSLGQGYLS